MAAKKVDPVKAKAKRQKIIAIVGAVILLGLLAFQVPRVMKQLRFDTVMGARQPFPSITAAMAATWAAEWVFGFFGCGFKSQTRTSWS